MKIEIIAALASSIISLIAGIMASRAIFKKKKFSTDNGVELIKIEKAEQWNELRQANLDWLPDLSSIVLRNLKIESANFSYLKFDNATIEKCMMHSCSFDYASMKNVKFVDCVFTDLSFYEADLSGAQFISTDLIRANFENASINKVIGLGPVAMPEVLPTKSIIENLRNNFDGIDEINPIEFELLIAELFKKFGYEIEITPPGKDYGVDLVLKRQDIVGESRIVVQAKKYSPKNKVGLSVLRTLAGAMYLNDASKGILITSSELSKEASEFVSSTNKISAIDRNGLKDLILAQENNS